MKRHLSAKSGKIERNGWKDYTLDHASCTRAEIGIPAHREELERIQQEGNGFYAWGAVPGLRNIPTWHTMERGDYVLCVYDSTYNYVTRVLGKCENEGFAQRVWSHVSYVRYPQAIRSFEGDVAPHKIGCRWGTLGL